ncbi:hypothetical protein [Terriglobus tenax]|uniref:hypothetical protein n=1 Tax=Terriglobus tenax TaxID=1111115 RepID=UPI0021E020CC|nr:hypothetical protein [Terriglobus tenax]
MKLRNEQQRNDAASGSKERVSGKVEREPEDKAALVRYYWELQPQSKRLLSELSDG